MAQQEHCRILAQEHRNLERQLRSEAKGKRADAAVRRSLSGEAGILGLTKNQMGWHNKACTIDPEQNKILRKNYYTLHDRTQSFTYTLDEQIDKLTKLGPKLGLSFNNTLNIFSTTFDASHCISTFVDLVPTKLIQTIKNQIEDLLGKDAFIHVNNIADAAKLVKQIGQEMDKLSQTMSKIESGDFDILEIKNQFDTVIEAL